MKFNNLPKLNERTKFEKILFIVQIVLSILVIITALFEIINIFTFAKGVSQILLACMFFVMFLEYRNYNTFQSYLSLAVSAVIICVLIL